jgi:hypothetical protein
LHCIVPIYVVNEPLNGTYIPILAVISFFHRGLFPMCFHACNLKVLHKIDPSDTDGIIEFATQFLDETPNMGGKWGPKGRLAFPYWYKHAVKIEAYANKDRDHSGNKDGLVDVKKDVTKSPEE